MKWYVIESEDRRKYLSSRVTEDILIKKGWGNGYVAVPPTHPLHLGNLETGNDTAHFGNTIEQWPKEAVEAETKRLFSQLLDIELGEL